MASGLGLFASSRHLSVNGFYHLMPLRFACKKAPATPPHRHRYTSPPPSLPPSHFPHRRWPRQMTTLDSDGDSDTTGPPEETPERETETRQEADPTGPQEETPEQEADATDRAREEEKPEQLETPRLSAHADETAAEVAQDVDLLKPEDGCATPPPPPPAHDSEGSDDDGSSPHGEEEEKPSAGASGKRPDVAATKSRLLAFRSFSWDKKGRKSGDGATPMGSVPSPGEHHRPVDGKAWEEAGAEHKEKGKARWKRLWK